MDLTYHSKNANSAQRLRARNHYVGYINGYPLWTSEEDAICRALHPDMEAIYKALPGRTKIAVEYRCSQTLGLKRRCVKSYTAREESDLRRAYSRDSTADLRARFSHRTLKAIRAKAQGLGLKRLRSPYCLTGNYLLDGLRARCHAEKISMRDLDEFAKSKGYFAEKRWRGTRGAINYRHIVRAIHELGGKLRIEWGDE